MESQKPESPIISGQVSALQQDILPPAQPNPSHNLPPSAPPNDLHNPPSNPASIVYSDGQLYGVNPAHTIALREVAKRLAAAESASYTEYSGYSTSCSSSMTSPCASPDYQSSHHFDFTSTQPSASTVYYLDPYSPVPLTYPITSTPAQSSQLPVTPSIPSQNVQTHDHDPPYTTRSGRVVKPPDCYGTQVPSDT